MTGAQALEAKGRREGRKEGRLEGRVEGQREILLEMMEFKFGSLTEETIAAVNNLTKRQVTQLARRILTAVSLEEMGL